MSGLTTLTIGGAPATVTFVSSTELTIVTGAGTAGLRNVVVSTPGGSDTLTNGYRYRAAPVINEVAPTEGPVAGGEGIAIIGTNFVNGATTITVAGVDVTASAQFTGSIVIGVVEPPAPGGVAGPVEVTVTTTGGTAYGTYTYTATGVPVNTVAPVVSGTASVGATLTTDDGTWTNSPTSFSYQWLRCDVSGNACTSIGGATSSSYVVDAADEGFTLRARVIATNASGSGQFLSAQTAVVTPA